MFKGVENLVDDVGSKGRNIVIEQNFGALKVTKDGTIVVRNIKFKDRIRNIGATLIKQVCKCNP